MKPLKQVIVDIQYGVLDSEQVLKEYVNQIIDRCADEAVESALYYRDIEDDEKYRMIRESINSLKYDI